MNRLNEKIGTNRVNDIIKKLYPKDLQIAPKRKGPLINIEENKIAIIALLCCALVAASMCVFFYNKLTTLYTDVTAAEAQIRTQLQKRGNIVTNLTKMVKDYSEHEAAMFKYASDTRKEVVTQANTLLTAAKSIDMANITDKEFSKFEGLLSKFMAWSENYPDLKLNTNFQDFMREIVLVETKIADARVFFNEKTNTYTTYRQQFPNYIFARLFNFKHMDFYKGTEEFQKFQEVKY